MPDDRDPDPTDAGDPDGDDPSAADDHLDDVPDGAGCFEVWDHLSERRDENE